MVMLPLLRCALLIRNHCVSRKVSRRYHHHRSSILASKLFLALHDDDNNDEGTNEELEKIDRFGVCRIHM